MSRGVVGDCISSFPEFTAQQTNARCSRLCLPAWPFAFAIAGVGSVSVVAPASGRGLYALYIGLYIELEHALESRTRVTANVYTAEKGRYRHMSAPVSLPLPLLSPSPPRLPLLSAFSLALFPLPTPLLSARAIYRHPAFPLLLWKSSGSFLLANYCSSCCYYPSVVLSPL